MKINWKKVLKVVCIALTAGMAHTGVNTVDNTEKTNVVTTMIIAAVAGALNTDNKKKE